MASPSGARFQAEIALASVTLIWGATFVLVKEALQDVSTVLFLTLRFVLAAFALLVAYRRRLKTETLKDGLGGGVFAGLCLFSAYLFQTFGLRLTTPSKSAFLTGLSIALVPLLGSAVYHVRPRRPELAGVAVATAGMALMTLEGASWWRIGAGDLLTIAGACAFAAHILAVGHWAPRIGFETLSFLQIATGAVMGLAAFWWVEKPVLHWSPALITALAVTGLLATALAFSVQSWAQRHTTATRTALLFALEPVFAAATSYLAIGETLSARAALGALLILGGILLVELKRTELKLPAP